MTEVFVATGICAWGGAADAATIGEPVFGDECELIFVEAGVVIIFACGSVGLSPAARLPVGC